MTAPQDLGTRDQILHLIVERGPITAGELAKILVLTPAAVRRHIATLVEENHIETYQGPSLAPARRGRPSRRYVATPDGQAQLGQEYSDLASDALQFVVDNLGEEGLEEFITNRISILEKRYAPRVAKAGDTPAEKAAALAGALNLDGHVSTLRRAGQNALTIQLCQGHCPVQAVAKKFPQLCEAETEAFSRLLGLPVQRLATLAGGEHVCTTNIPLAYPEQVRARFNKRNRQTSDGVLEGNR